MRETFGQSKSFSPLARVSDRLVVQEVESGLLGQPLSEDVLREINSATMPNWAI
jgi:hypothetical protein